MTICKNFPVCQSLPYEGRWQGVSIDGEVVQKQRLDIKLPLLCRISPQCVHGAPVRGFHGGEQLVGTVQRAAARGHGIGNLLKRHDAKLLSGSDQRQVKFSWGGVRSAASIRTFHNRIDKDITLKA